MIVGHLSIDSIILPTNQKPYVILGGSASYASLSAQRLGANVSIITKIGGDFPQAYLWWLKQEDVDVSSAKKIEESCTTRFELKYSEDLSDRVLRLLSKAPLITVDDMPKALRAKAVHIAPITNEVEYEVVEKMHKCADFLSLDPQGFLRIFDENGSVSYGLLGNKNVLEFVDIFKSSVEEIKFATGISDVNSAIKSIHDFGVKIVITTMGVKGAVLSIEGATYNVPACIPEKIVDPTGAGDVFIGAFLTEYIKGEDSMWCACVGSAAASIAVENVGPTFPNNVAEIYRRANALCEKEI